MRLKHKCCLFLAFCVLLPLAAPIALAMPEEIVIDSVADLQAFSRNCSLDSWSQDKTVRLAADLDLTGISFSPIPTFGGTFLGEHHTISGLHLTHSGSRQGLFRHIQKSGTVQELTVKGTVAPEGSRSNVGGVVGVNEGKVLDCSFHGTVEGDSAVGGIVGRNELDGQVAGCTTTGFVQGETAAGGVAGRNLGTLLKCQNAASVNIFNQDEDGVAASALEETESMLDARDAGDEMHLLDSHTDTGGVAGYSSGILQSCVNDGKVGYPHVGYNVGGIVGRQTGYLAGCVNHGPVYGRKDVGGITGQLEPYIAVDAGGDTLERLRKELDTLETLLDKAIDDANRTGDDISARLSRIGAAADGARDNSKILLEHLSDFVDSNVDGLSTIASDITNALDKLGPALDELSNSALWIERLARQLEDVLEELEFNGDSIEKLQEAIRGLSAAADDLRSAIAQMRSAVDTLTNALWRDDLEAAGQALRAMKEAISKIGDSLGSVENALQKLEEALSKLPGLSESLQHLRTALKRLAEALKEAARRLPEKITQKREEIEAAISGVRDARREIQEAVEDMGQAAAELMAAIDGALSGGEFDGAKDGLQSAADLAAGFSRSLKSAFDAMGDAVEELAEGGVTFTPLGQEVREAGDNLYTSLSDLGDEAAALREVIDGANGLLTANLRAVNRQLNTVFQVLLDTVENFEEDLDKENYIEDTSEENIEHVREGKLADSQNAGIIEGDRNVGGVTGAVAIEYDLDPEDDIRFSIGSSYETKAVVQRCVNRGVVTAKKDCAGGVAGRMDLGTAIACQNYGPIESTGGDYVGGISGSAAASLRENYVKCVLTGRNYVGGIVGWGERLRSNCAITTVADSQEYVGAIAGDADLENGTVAGNVFVDTGIAAVDGVSYAGRAEPVAFEALRERPDVPAELVAFTLTLIADEKQVAKIPFSYGEDLTLIELPEVPAMEGHYGRWPAFSTSGLDSDLTLEAVYTPWITLLSSQEGKPLAMGFAEGRFTEDAVLHISESVAPPPAECHGREDARVLEVSLSGAEAVEADEVPLRLYAGTGRWRVWRLEDGIWQSVQAEQNGQYLLLKMTGLSGTFCICGAESASLPGMAVGLGAAAAAAVLLARKARKKRVRTKTIVTKMK